MANEQFDRNIRFFGKEGQARLSASHVAVVGIGGLGTHVVQQLALLGVGHLTLIDKEELDKTNTNRYIGIRYDDPIPGTHKLNNGERIVKEINPKIHVEQIPFSLLSKESFKAITQAQYVFGCLDREGARLVLNELCAAHSKPYFDLSSDILPGDPPSYGGRVCVAWDGKGCIVCYGELDVAEAQADLAGPDVRQNREAIYGVNREVLNQVGPSVVSINGVVASFAVTEFMLAVTGIRTPKRLITYHGHRGIVTVTKEEPFPDCYYCKGVRGKGDAADVQRYLKSGITL
jgi:hypothetical protein